MGREAKYSDTTYGRQKAYLKTKKGKAALKKYQSSEKGKQIKKDWWHKNRSTTPLDRRQYFVEKYGDAQSLLCLLNEKEKEVITRHYGLDGTKPITLTAIAKEKGKSQQWISQLKKSALNKLAAKDFTTTSTE